MRIETTKTTKRETNNTFRGMGFFPRKKKMCVCVPGVVTLFYLYVRTFEKEWVIAQNVAHFDKRVAIL